MKSSFIEALPWIICGIVGAGLMLHSQPELVIGYVLFKFGERACNDIAAERRKAKDKPSAN